MNKEGFKMLCRPNKSDLFDWLVKQMTEYYGQNKIVATNDYLFCIGDIPACICAHLDTVHKRTPKIFVDDGNIVSSPQGVGGDDRCGVYSCLSVLSHFEAEGKKPYMFFSTDEEVGGASTKKAAKDVKHLIAEIGFLIELDRNGKQDSVYYKCDNKKFKKWIDSFGFIEAQGTFTDICTLCDEWDVAGVNLSVGYYKAHTSAEYVIYDELQATIDKVVKILSESDGTVYPFMKKEYTTTYYNNYKITNLFAPGDEVIVRFNGASAYDGPTIKDSYVFRIPEWTRLVVKEVNGAHVKVEYNKRLVWISDFNIYLDYN